MRRSAFTTSRSVAEFVKREFILTLFLLLLALLVSAYPPVIDSKPIIALARLIVIATGLNDSGYFDLVSGSVLRLCRFETIAINAGSDLTPIGNS